MTHIADPADLELKHLRAMTHFAGQRVLEIGTGDARLAWPLAPEAALWVAVDPDVEEMATAAGDLRNDPVACVRLVLGDGRALCLPSNAFDLALFTWSLC